MKNPTPYNGVRTIFSTVLATLLAVFLCFFPAQSPVPEFSGLAMMGTLLFIASWYVSAYEAGRNTSRSFAIFAVGYWGVAYLLHFLLNLAEITGVSVFVDLAFFGLLMLFVPLYGIIGITSPMGIDILVVYPVVFLLMALIYLSAYRKGKAAKADAEMMEGFAVSPSAGSSSTYDPYADQKAEDAVPQQLDDPDQDR